jgi:hypothetical protein
LLESRLQFSRIRQLVGISAAAETADDLRDRLDRVGARNNRALVDRHVVIVCAANHLVQRAGNRACGRGVGHRDAAVQGVARAVKFFVDLIRRNGFGRIADESQNDLEVGAGFLGQNLHQRRIDGLGLCGLEAEIVHFLGRYDRCV